MDVWIGGWDGWDGLLEVWIGECVDGWIGEWWMCGLVDLWIGKWLAGCVDW